MKQGIIQEVIACEVLDSRGMPTVSASVRLSDGALGRAAVPSGASKGTHEASELRDGDPARYRGKGVLTAVRNVTDILAPALIGKNAYDQSGIDRIMITLDGTKNKSDLGANAILSLSLAVARASAVSLGLPLYRYLGGTNRLRLPVPMMNILNGGAHASNNLDIQEFMIVPHGFASLRDGIRAGAEIYAALRGILLAKGLSVAVGDEGGFAPDLASDETALELLVSAIGAAGYSVDEVGIALDIAATEWRSGDGYDLPKRGEHHSAESLGERWQSLLRQYPILSIEDPLSEDDFDDWRHLTDAVGEQCLLVGDDLFVTDAARLRHGIECGAGNAILIKPNQVGTLSETMRTIRFASDFGYRHILSHRSGDTADTTIADLAVATGAQFIKSGAPCRSERVEKYNRLLEIEAELGENAVYGF